MTAYAEVLRRLYGLAKFGRELRLERMQAACARFNHPERAFEVVHVAGTNGKGTVCALTASMLRAAGRRTGLYTSPHLCRFAERIQVDGAPVADEVLGPWLERVMQEAPELTFFEVATLAAFLVFRELGVEVAVLEVGLGGRLDATNVVPAPRVAAITRIAFDHRAELGDSLAAIAGEKAGIIKPGSAVVCGKLHPEARAVIEAKVEATGARLVPLGSPEPRPNVTLAYPRVATLGSNLAVAVTIARELGLSEDAMCRGIEGASWPGRNELLHREDEDLTLLDCAHNPDGAVALAQVVEASFLPELESRQQLALLFGAVDTKNWRGMLQRLAPLTPQRLYVKAPVPSGIEPELFCARYPGEVLESIAAALARGRELVGPEGLLVITGSCFVVGQARALLLDLPTDPPVNL